VAVYYSHSLDKILAYIMKKSDNQIAENIFRTQALENYPEVVYTTTQAIASLKNVVDKALNIKCGKDYMLMDG
jgi:D-alanyl-D-alanine carboxypeptidase/D-alanyl-D-alanine-endopeptidase (penicillin-binding protein 4)